MQDAREHMTSPLTPKFDRNELKAKKRRRTKSSSLRDLQSQWGSISFMDLGFLQDDLNSICQIQVQAYL